MADIPANVAAEISGKAVDQGFQEAYYLCCFNNIVADFEKEKQDLVVKRQSVQNHINQAINQTDEISIDVKHWLEKADSLIEEDTKTKRTYFFQWLPNCIWRYRRGKDLVRKTQKINKLNGCNVFKNFSLPTTLPDIEYYSSKDFVEFQSRKLAYKQLLEALKDDDKYMIGLQGIGGAGKTTLAIRVGKEVKESRLFDYVVKVTISNTPNIKNIQEEIASPLGLKLEEENELERAKRLWKRLTNGERILMILDDVWERLDFENVGIPPYSHHNKCHVLLTTRDTNVCKKMGCNSMIELDFLSEQDAWLLFQKCAGLGEDSPSILMNKGQEITKECKGLPIAIATIASTLKGEKEENWDLALRSLKNIDDNDEDLIQVYRRLQVSYDYLKVKEAKELFLLCSIFPEDYEISNEDLTIYAIGMGLCEGLNSFEKARDCLHRATKKLIDCCLLLKVNERQCVKMHDLLHDLAHWMERGKIKVIMEPGNNLNALEVEAIGKKSSLRYLYCHNINNFPNLFNHPKLEILILEFGIELFTINIPDTFFEGIKDLKVCTLLGKRTSHIIRSFPKSFMVLKSLRTLTLRGWHLGDFSVLEKLHMLESLRLESCSIDEIPSGIVQLKKLKLLSFKDCEIKKNSYEVMGQIVPQLEELYFMNWNNLYGEIDNKVLIEFLNKCPALKRYHIWLVEQHHPMSSLNHLTSRALSVAYFDASTSNTIVKDLMKRAEILHLHKMQGDYKTIIPNFVEAIGDMNELTEIVLDACSEIEFFIDTSKGCSSIGIGFSKLINIVLRGMGYLKAFCQGSPPSNFLENLQEMWIHNCFQLNSTLLMGHLKLKRLKILDVRCCLKLMSLFTLSIAQSLVLLERLTIDDCEGLESIITDDNEKNGKEIVKNDHDQLTLFLELRCLDIIICPQFRGLMSFGSNERQLLDVAASSESQASNSQYNHLFDTPQCLLRQSLISRNIREMRIESCHKLTSLFVVSILQTMLLEKLDIRSCDGLKHIIIDDNNDHDHKVYNSFMPKLKYLYVEGCSQLKYVFGQSYHEDHLSYPYHNIQIEIDFLALEYLELKELPNIISICQNNYHPKLLALKEFKLKECPQFTIITISDFIGYRDMRQLDCLKRKDSGVETMHMHTLEELSITTSKIEGIFYHEELGVFGQHVISKLKYLKLKNLSEMSYIFKGPKHMCSLENLAHLSLKACGKLKVIISTSLVRSFPQLNVLIIADYESLEQIVEEDEENQNLSNLCFKQVCFPELKYCVVKNCNKLKHLFCMNTHNEFPKLKELLVMEAPDLEELFGTSGYSEREQAMQNNLLPKLDQVILVKLPSLLTNVWLYKLQTVKDLLMHNCPMLSLTSTIKVEDLQWRYEFCVAGDPFEYTSLLRDVLTSIEHEADSEGKLCSSWELGIEELINEASLVDQQQTFEETKDNTQQCMPHNMAESSHETDESLLTKNAETLQAQELGVTVPIANSLDLIGELVEKESSKETITMDQMAFEKSIKASVEEGKIVTFTESQRSTTDILVASLSGSSSQIFVEKGLMEPPSKQNNSERLEKPLDLAQNTSLQINKETAEHGVIDSRKSENAEDKDGETVVQSVREIANPPPAPLIPLQKQSALELMEKESSNQAITTDQMAFGKTKSDNMKGSVQEGSESRIAKIVTSPQDFVEKGSKESTSKDVVQQNRSSIEAGETLVEPSDIAQKTPPQAPIKGLQTGTHLDEEDTEGNSLDLQNLMDNIHSLFDSMEKDKQLVAKAFAGLETYLNMPLKGIANSDSNNNGLVNALKFLSSWSFGDGSSSEAPKATVNSLIQNLSNLLSSFKQASPTIDKFTMLEKKHESIMEELHRRKEKAYTLEKSVDDAQQKKEYLKEKFHKLQAELKSTENEIKEHDGHLMSLKDQGKKLQVETENFFKEFEAIKKD